VRSFGQELLPEVLLDLPKVGCLSGEGGAMHLTEGGEPFAVVAAEIAVDSLVGEFLGIDTYNLNSEHFGVGERRERAALADNTTMALNSVVYETEDGHDESAKIHKKKTSVAYGAIGLTPNVRRSSLRFKSSTKTCTRG
jgi:hypothetical protein